ncbi:hypothetical protein [Flavobacterium algicola]|uniref:hypothetical protein n=1 Tax=Flavobacterium algicola TaxID=556529 RepID=UPI001EFE6345|nr:hypothetical protein [Flavobacterium algicola]MCG9794030.1 hypothetical protein [Flavobacterium algicola]
MLQKIKQTSIVLTTLFYLVQFSLSFSGGTIDCVQQARHQNQISKINSITHKTILLTEWKQLNNKKEIKINQDYFDIHSFSIVSNYVVLKVVKDDFESDIIVGLQNLFLKAGSTSKKQSKVIKGIIFYATLHAVESLQLKTISKVTKLMVIGMRSIGTIRTVIFLIDKPPICFTY